MIWELWWGPLSPKSEIRSYYSHKQSDLLLKKKKKKKKKTVGITWPSAHVPSCLPGCLLCLSEKHLDMPTMAWGPGYPPGASDSRVIFLLQLIFFSSYQLGTWRIPLSSSASQPDSPSGKHPFCVPVPTLVFLPL